MKKTATVFALIASAISASPAFSQSNIAFDSKIELRLSHRNSEDLSLAAPFPPNTFLQTADPGSHLEVSNFTFYHRMTFSENTLLNVKIDAIDLYERNPTTSDRKVDLDLLFFRYGKKHTQGLLPEKTTYYGQIGKFGKFERQEDRHLESYGLVSTAFNRLEDSGIELGLDLPIGLYLKLAYTTGNPLFFRDPNALAGDNGVEFGKDAENPKYNSGFPVLYDAEVESFDLSENPETSLGLGYRWLSDDGLTRINTLVHYNKRELADTIELEGTGYGGDLDLLQVIIPAEVTAPGAEPFVGFDIQGREKIEAGLTLWLYHDNFSFFAQYVDQEFAGQSRTGSEFEISYMFTGIPYIDAVIPAFRYSQLRNDFDILGPYPAQSVDWDWDKYDIGATVRFNDYVSLIVEHSDNQFVRQDKDESYGETLVTLLMTYRF